MEPLLETLSQSDNASMKQAFLDASSILTDLPSGVVSGVLTAPVLFALGYVMRGTLSSRRARRERTQQRALEVRASPKYSAEWLRRYYFNRGAIGDLYLLRGVGREIRIPVLTAAAWIGSFSEEEIIASGNLDRSNVAENKKLIETRRRYVAKNAPGGEIWNDDMLTVTAIAQQTLGSPPVLRLGIASYFQFLSTCGALEDETFAAIRHTRGTTAKRDAFLSSFDTARQLGLGAHGLGMQVTLVYRDSGQYKVVIQKRSTSVTTYAGAFAVVPVFACQPFDYKKADAPSLMHNFLREYYEELHGGEDVIRKSAHIADDWFYSEPAIKSFLEAVQSGKVTFRTLGIGFDALNGEVNIAAIVLFREENVARSQLRAMKGNWEISNVELEPLFSDALENRLFDDSFQPGSAFSLSLAMEYVRGL